MPAKKKLVYTTPAPPCKPVNVPLLAKEMEEIKVRLDNMWMVFKP